MILVRAPMRISYVGGGTDYPDYFKDSPGGVIATAIKKYVYVYSNPLSEIATENFRFTYRQSESVDDYRQFQHPVIREMLSHLNWDSRQNMGTFADLPSGIGLGGSSAFSVALGKLLEDKLNQTTPRALAELAIHIERNLLSEPGGYQDQFISAFGGFRAYDFNSTNDLSVSEPLLNTSEFPYLEERQMLVWVGQTRNSATYSLTTLNTIKTNRQLLENTYEIYLATKKALNESKGDGEKTYKVLSTAVQESWNLKKQFAAVNDEAVNQIIVHSTKLLTLELKFVFTSITVLVH